MSPEDSLEIRAAALFRELQTSICTGLEALEPSARFRSDHWRRTDATGSDGGGGESRIIRDGRIFEQGGVNFSHVHGSLPAQMAERMGHAAEDTPFSACGVSLVLHPQSPLVPTVHANFRFVRVGEKEWFGGGSDLTPSYLFHEDARHFHGVLKQTCDRWDPEHYPRFKKWCDEYFFLPHRGEARGVGGIFFDYLGRDDGKNPASHYDFMREIGHAFLPAYIPVVERRMDQPWSEAQRAFQLWRRGRYVEFNLLHDRGTHFGLQTKGRTESILMSLPPLVRWEYGYEPAAGTPESEMLEVVRTPRAWIV